MNVDKLEQSGYDGALRCSSYWSEWVGERNVFINCDGAIRKVRVD